MSRTPTAERLTAIGDAFDALAQAAGSGDPRRIVETDMAFHAAIVAMLGSSRLDEFYAELTLELRFYLMVLSVEDREYERKSSPSAADDRAIRHGTGPKASLGISLRQRRAP